MKYIGIALIFLGAYIAVRENRAREREGLELLLGYESFAREMRSRTVGALEPVTRWVGSFCNSSLESAGFLPAVRNGAGLSEAFAVASHKLKNSAKEILGELFSRTGSTFEDEIKRIDRALSALEGIVADERRASEERVRLFSLLALAASAGIGILAL